MDAKNKTRSYALLAIKALVTIGAFWFIFQTVELTAVLNSARQASLPLVLFAALFLMLQVVVNGVRWSIIARADGVNLPSPIAILYFWQSLFFGQLSPMGVAGDAWRVYVARTRHPSLSSVMNSVVLDRLAGFVGLIGIVTAGFFASAIAGQQPTLAELLAVAAFTFALTTGVITLVNFHKVADNFAKWDKFKIVSSLKDISVLVRQSLGNPRAVLLAVALSGVGHILTVLAVWLICLALGLSTSILTCLIVIPIALMIAMLPVTISGWGLREGAIVAGLAQAGAALEPATAVSVMFGLGLAVNGLLGGALILLTKSDNVISDFAEHEAVAK